uniref:Uncharacterized protein n=2 Tax=viral metagenome TaxID=1070528 RepID=A0A6H1ZY77_9ZZZZ
MLAKKKLIGESAMTRGLSDKLVKYLNILVYVLISMMGILIAWNTNYIFQVKDQVFIMREALPKEFVQLERYLSDERKLEGQLNRIYDEIKAVGIKVDGLKK